MPCEEYLCGFDSRQLTALQKRQDTGFLSEFLSRQLKAVTAIVCCNDEIAYWLVKELSYRNMRVPEDVSVVCFDCSYLSDLSAVQMTCYAQQTHGLGTAAAESVISLMKGASVLPQNSPWQLVIKRSAAPPAI